MSLKIETLYKYILYFNEISPNKKAIVFDDKAITYSELLYIAESIIYFLKKSNLDKNSIVLIDQYPVDFFIASMAAIMDMGFIPVPVDFNNKISSEDIIRQTKPSVVFTNNRSINSNIIEHDKIVFYDRVNVGMDIHSSCKKKNYRIPHKNNISSILFSSGTTSGIRKGVVQTYGQHQSTVEYITDIMNITRDIVEYIASPLESAFGMGRARVVLKAGGTIVCNSGIINPGIIAKNIDKHKCNALSADSAVYDIFIKFAQKWLLNNGHKLKWLKIASSPLSKSKKLELVRLLPNTRMFMNYGLTEAMRSTINEFSLNKNKIDSVGMSSPGVCINIVDKNGDLTIDNDIGEIIISGPNVAKTYWDNNELWMSRFKDGWFYTGDLGYLDRDGFLYIIGRKDDVINIGGRKFHPEEVEKIILERFDGIDVSVVGVSTKDSFLGEEVHIFVENACKTLTVLDIRKGIENDIENFKMPSVLHFIKKFPKTENGKVKKRILRKLALKGQIYE